MMHTPFLPALRRALAPMGARTAPTLAKVRSQTLSQLETCLAPWMPDDLFPKAPQKENSRDRCYTRGRTFWCMLWQALHPGAPGREVVRQIQAFFQIEDGPKLSEQDGAYCRAKARLPLSGFAKALSATAQAADQEAGLNDRLQGRPLKAVDGSAITLADTPKNRKAYPPLQCAQVPSFPMMRIVVLFSALSGTLLAVAAGSLAVSELGLLSSLLAQLHRGDILAGDRGFGGYPLVALLHSLGVDFLGRTTRRMDGRRRLKRLGSNDWLVLWKRSATASPWLSAAQGAGVPLQLTVRAVKGRCQQKGFRARTLTVVTTLLDAEQYPAREILEAYLRRWRLEMCLDDLKTTLRLDSLPSRSPAMAQKELHARLIAHNLIRCVAAQAAAQGGVPLERVSFKGCLDGLRHFAQALARVRSRTKRRQLWDELYRTLAADLVPERPGRREPRAVKRKKNKYPRLDQPRHQFRDHPKRNIRRKRARLRRLGLM